MSAAINPVADATTSAFDQVKQGVVDAAYWLGRQVTWIAGSIKDFAIKVVEAVKPVFAAIIGFIRDQAIRAKDFVLANQQLTLGVGAVVLVLALGVLVGVKFFGGSSENKDAPKVDAAKADADKAAPKVEAPKVEAAK
jgi:hypothetical protein